MPGVTWAKEGGPPPQVGQYVQAPWLGRDGPGRSEGHIYKALITAFDGAKAHVHYVDWGRSTRFDSWVPGEALLPPYHGQSPIPIQDKNGLELAVAKGGATTPDSSHEEVPPKLRVN